MKRTVKASSIIEVSITLVIVSLVFGMAAAIFMRVEQSAFSTRKFAAGVALDAIFEKNQSGTPVDETTYDTEYFQVYRTEDKHKDNKKLLVVRLEARDIDGKLIAERKYLLYDQASE